MDGPDYFLVPIQIFTFQNNLSPVNYLLLLVGEIIKLTELSKLLALKMEIIKKLLFQKIITRPVGRQLFITQGRGESPGCWGRCLSDNDDDLLLQQQKRATPNLENRICKFLEVLDS